MKKALILFGMIFAILLGGCTQNYTSKTPTDFVVVEQSKEVLEKAATALLRGQPVEGATYLTGKSPVVSALIQATDAVGRVRFGGDYQKISGREAYGLFSQDKLARAIEENLDKQIRDYYVNAQLVAEVTDVTVEKIVLGDKMTFAGVFWHADVTIHSIAESQQTAYHMKPGDTVSYRSLTWFVEENGLWKVSEDHGIAQ